MHRLTAPERSYALALAMELATLEADDLMGAKDVADRAARRELERAAKAWRKGNRVFLVWARSRLEAAILAALDEHRRRPLPPVEDWPDEAPAHLCEADEYLRELELMP